VPYFLKLFVDAALLQLDAATLRGMRPKRRVLLVRFLAKALLCPYYRWALRWEVTWCILAFEQTVSLQELPPVAPQPYHSWRLPALVVDAAGNAAAAAAAVAAAGPSMSRPRVSLTP
jgi:hypothetical protein